MAKTLFILGRPGSGKSAAFRRFNQYIKNKYGWTAVHYNDYEILQGMFQFERLFQFDHKLRKFRATKHGGFDVLDFSVLDTALKELGKKVRSRYSKNEKDELIVIEFARNDYNKALNNFNAEFLKDAYILFLDTDLGTCINRVQERVAHPTCEDDHFVSENILRSYYNKQVAPSKFGAEKRKLKVINNKGSFETFIDKLDRFVENILVDELIIADYKNVGMVGANYSNVGSDGQFHNRIVHRSAFHLPSISTKALTSLFSSSQQKVK